MVEFFAQIDWSATGAMIGGVSTFVVAVLTFSLIRENKLLRRAGNSPLVVAHFETHPDGNGAVNLVFSNVGTGPAFDVAYSFEQQDFNNYDLIFRNEGERPPLTMLGQGEKFSFIFAVGFNLFRPRDPEVSKHLQPFRVNVSWRSLGSRRVCERSYRLDVAAYSGLPGIVAKPVLVKVHDELSAMNKHLERLTRMVSKSPVFVEVGEIKDGVAKIAKRGVSASE